MTFVQGVQDDQCLGLAPHGRFIWLVLCLYYIVSPNVPAIVGLREDRICFPVYQCSPPSFSRCLAGTTDSEPLLLLQHDKTVPAPLVMPLSFEPRCMHAGHQQLLHLEYAPPSNSDLRRASPNAGRAPASEGPRTGCRDRFIVALQ